MVGSGTEDIHLAFRVLNIIHFVLFALIKVRCTYCTTYIRTYTIHLRYNINLLSRDITMTSQRSDFLNFELSRWRSSLRACLWGLILYNYAHTDNQKDDSGSPGIHFHCLEPIRAAISPNLDVVDNDPRLGAHAVMVAACLLKARNRYMSPFQSVISIDIVLLNSAAKKRA